MASSEIEASWASGIPPGANRGWVGTHLGVASFLRFGRAVKRMSLGDKDTSRAVTFREGKLSFHPKLPVVPEPRVQRLAPVREEKGEKKKKKTHYYRVY